VISSPLRSVRSEFFIESLKVASIDTCGERSDVRGKARGWHVRAQTNTHLLQRGVYAQGLPERKQYVSSQLVTGELKLQNEHPEKACAPCYVSGSVIIVFFSSRLIHCASTPSREEWGTGGRQPHGELRYGSVLPFLLKPASLFLPSLA